MDSYTYLEEKIIGERLYLPKLELNQIIKIFENATVINTLQRHIEPNWVQRFFTQIYNNTNINEYWIKSFLICQYPLSVIELLLKDEERDKFRNIKGLILDINIDPGTTEFEAYIRKISEKENLIVFNEQFYNFLFDYHLIEQSLVSKNKISRIENPDDLLFTMQESFYLKYDNNYHGFDINKFLEFDEHVYGNIFKFKLLSTLIFIFSHEIAHCYLGHTRRNIWELALPYNTYNTTKKEIPFNQSQLDELDADMFSSDICMNFIHSFGNMIDDGFRTQLMHSYFSFLWHFAKLEEKDQKEINTNPNATHPSAKYRVIYLMLRNKKYYEKLNMPRAVDLIEQFEKIKDNLMYYNFKKDFGVGNILKY